MASWMVHLRIADQLLDQFPSIVPTEFIVGNIAPDSGVPDKDWSSYTPNGTVSHFRTDDTKEIHIEDYVKQYFTKAKIAHYSEKEKSFYFGYLIHLITEILWHKQIWQSSMLKNKDLDEGDTDKLIWEMKKDWYDLDFLYLKEHPSFRAYEIYNQLLDLKINT